MRHTLRHCLLSFTFFLTFQVIQAQPLPRPKLVVGLVVDQMRWDFLYRYYERYGNGGFKRLLNEGHSCENTLIPYTPTYTAAGHACVYTGSVPALNGIIGNDWYRTDLGKAWYCTDDSTVVGVGSDSPAGKMSPRNLWATTITDELRLATNFAAKTVGVCIKDRGSILPAGHSATAAFWFDATVGRFITSTYYTDKLPGWAQQFNDKKLPDQYMAQNWNLLYASDSYKQSTTDDRPYEGPLNGEDHTFPHMTSIIQKGKYEALRKTPFGNTLTLEMAKAVIEGEQLGQRGVTDFLAVSLSSPDYIGHSFGPNSMEVEDTYLRLDQDLAALLTYLDERIGKGQYTFFLTADHGVAHVPGFLAEHKIPNGSFNNSEAKKWINDAAKQAFGLADAILAVYNYQVYINYKALSSKEIDKEDFTQWLIDKLKTHPGIFAAFELAELPETPLPAEVKEMLVKGYNYKLSGQVQYLFKPQWMDGEPTGTTHGVWNPYDAHIPLVWFGWGIQPGRTVRTTYMTDIAATLATLLRIQQPNACVGQAIGEVIAK